MDEDGEAGGAGEDAYDEDLGAGENVSRSPLFDFIILFSAVCRLIGCHSSRCLDYFWIPGCHDLFPGSCFLKSVRYVSLELNGTLERSLVGLGLIPVFYSSSAFLALLLSESDGGR